MSELIWWRCAFRDSDCCGATIYRFYRKGGDGYVCAACERICNPVPCTGDHEHPPIRLKGLSERKE